MVPEPYNGEDDQCYVEVQERFIEGMAEDGIGLNDDGKECAGALIMTGQQIARPFGAF